VTGVGVDDNIRSAYQFIAQNFVPGDEIYLFGFSRGAFTARSLAGLITACGILFRQSLGALMVWGRANIAEDEQRSRDLPMRSNQKSLGSA
jgi:uncharacterized protein (DUF2235 family)